MILAAGRKDGLGNRVGSHGRRRRSGLGRGESGQCPAGRSRMGRRRLRLSPLLAAPAVAGAVIDSGRRPGRATRLLSRQPLCQGGPGYCLVGPAARLQDRPLHELLDGCRTSVEVGPTFDRMESIDQLLAAIGQAVDAGYGRIKLKFRPGWDVEMLRAVRQEFPTQTMHIDCEGGLSLQHTEMLCRLDDFCLAMIEQPLPPDDLVGHAMVQDMLRTPLGLDESITTPAQADMALDLHSCKWVSLKPGRVGGLTAAMAIHDACHEQCTPCWVGAMPQSAVAARAGLALAAKANCSYPADRFFSEDLLAADLADPLLPVREADGVRRVPLWTTPGIGIEPDAKLLEKFCLQRATIS